MKVNKKDMVVKYGSSEKDTGSTKVQVALLTEKIRYLTDHLRVHKSDYASRVGLMKAVGKRARLLKYLQSQSFDDYKSLIADLNIRK